MAKWLALFQQNLIFFGCIALGLAALMWMFFLDRSGARIAAFAVYFIYRGIYGIYTNVHGPVSRDCLDEAQG